MSVGYGSKRKSEKTDKKKKFTTQSVKKFLSKTGFPFQWEMERLLKEENWGASNMYFLDLEKNKRREIDIVGFKTINNIEVYLIIECKFSKQDSWIFFEPGEKIQRYHGHCVCSPRPSSESFEKISNNLRIFNTEETTAINFKTCEMYTEKQSNETVVRNALYKVVKALIYFYSTFLNRTKRQIYFSLILFSGPIFSASYKNKEVQVKKTNYVQYPFEFESDDYIAKKKEPNNEILNKEILTELIPSHDFYEEWKTKEIKGVKEAYGILFNEHMIEFVTGDEFKDYIKKLESEIKKIDINLWPTETDKK
jgi:hypothetical protein